MKGVYWGYKLGEVPSLSALVRGLRARRRLAAAGAGGAATAPQPRRRRLCRCTMAWAAGPLAYGAFCGTGVCVDGSLNCPYAASAARLSVQWLFVTGHTYYIFK